MIAGLFLVLNASLSVLSPNARQIASTEISERTKNLIVGEISARSQTATIVHSSEQASLIDSYFQDGYGNWTDSSFSWYWDDDWYLYNCYAYAIPRHDIRPEYYQFTLTLPDRCTKWYEPGLFIHNMDYDSPATAEDVAEKVAEDFEALGFTNISYFRLPSSLPVLGENEELIAVRVGGCNSHFMRYCKDDGFWYHKPAGNAVLKYKYQLSEYRDWSNERLAYNGNYFDGTYYTDDIWLIKYTKVTLKPTFFSPAHESINCRSYGDAIAAVKIDDAGELEISFSNTNGFTAILYSEDWGAIAMTNTNLLASMVEPGRYYLLLNTYRYDSRIGIDAYLTPSSRSSYDNTHNLIVVNENDQIVAATSSGDALELATFPADQKQGNTL